MMQFQVDGVNIGTPLAVTEAIADTSIYSTDKVKMTAGKHRVSLVFANGATKAEYDTAVAAAAAQPPPRRPTPPAAPVAQTPTTQVLLVRIPATTRPVNAGQSPLTERPELLVQSAVMVKSARPQANPTAQGGAAGQAAGGGLGGAGAQGAGGGLGGHPVRAVTLVARAPVRAALVVLVLDEPALVPVPDEPVHADAARGAGGRGGGGSVTGKATVGVVFVEVEGPVDITPDRMPESYKRVFVAYPSPTVTKAQAAEIIRNFAYKAYRRPVDEDEVKRLMAFWAKDDASGESFDDSIHTVLQAVLVSPYFLYRYEVDPTAADPGGVRTLDEYELASRLSYFLWSSMPDDQLSIWPPRENSAQPPEPGPAHDGRSQEFLDGPEFRRPMAPAPPVAQGERPTPKSSPTSMIRSGPPCSRKPSSTSPPS